MDGRERRVERSAITAVVPVLVLVPFWLLAMVVIWAPFGLLTDIPVWAAPLTWLALGVVLLVPPVQTAVLSPWFGARRAHPAEEAVIGPIWTDLAGRVGLPADRYALRVVDSDDLNAFACGGRLLIVTSFALEHLTPRQLAGVLAHELSHHLGWHTAALTVGHWLSLPVAFVARIGFFLQNVARAATDSFATRSTALTVLGRFVALLIRAVAWVFLAALLAVDATANLAAQGSEFEADRRAVRLGYGRDLSDALRVVIRSGGGSRPVGWRARLAASHPPARTRVARIEAMMRHPSR